MFFVLGFASDHSAVAFDRLVPKFACRRICRTRVRCTDPWPQTKGPHKGALWFGGQGGIRTLERLL